jgi:hypothetical protein
VTGRQALLLAVVAQDVQLSGDSGAYAHWVSVADALVVTCRGRGQRLPERQRRPCARFSDDTFAADFTLPAGTPAERRPLSATPPPSSASLTRGRYRPGSLRLLRPGDDGLSAAGILIPRTTFQRVLAGTPLYGLNDLETGGLRFSPKSDGTAADRHVWGCTSVRAW